MPLPPPPPPPTRRSPDRRPALATAAAVLSVATLTVGIGAVALGLHDDGLDHPDTWDPRVRALADYVEQARGLDFDHPVHVDFLTPEEYTAAATTDVAELQAEEVVELERGAAQLRGLGVVSGAFDLAAALNQATDAGTLAFYSTDDERIRVRGTELSVGLRVTLVHELTHALQDQHFDLGGLLEDDDVDSSESVARRGLGEGDATRIESQYEEEVLTDEERAAYEAEYEAELAASEAATAEIPAFIRASFATPYALGSPFVRMLANQGGNEAVDDAFGDPPSTEEHLFDPASFVLGEGALEVEHGVDGDDAEVLDEGPFGSSGWFFVLAERIDPEVAFEAALGWGGDAYALYERDGVTCTRAVFVGDTVQDEEQMRAALDAWAAAMPGGGARRVDVEGFPALDACDPGPDVDLQVTNRSLDVLLLPNAFAELVAETIGVMPASRSRCVAGTILDEVSYERFAAEDESVLAEVDAAAAVAAERCGTR